MYKGNDPKLNVCISILPSDAQNDVFLFFDFFDEVYHVLTAADVVV